jgi:hypothetical protein
MSTFGKADTPLVTVTDLADMLKNPPTAEERSQHESGYRAGYRDAWIVCLDAFASALGPEVYARGWDFWAEELRAWIFDRPGQRVTPPELPAHETRK